MQRPDSCAAAEHGPHQPACEQAAPLHGCRDGRVLCLCSRCSRQVPCGLAHVVAPPRHRQHRWPSPPPKRRPHPAPPRQPTTCPCGTALCTATRPLSCFGQEQTLPTYTVQSKPPQGKCFVVSPGGPCNNSLWPWQTIAAHHKHCQLHAPPMARQRSSHIICHGCYGPGCSRKHARSHRAGMDALASTDILIARAWAHKRMYALGNRDVAITWATRTVLSRRHGRFGHWMLSQTRTYSSHGHGRFGHCSG